MEISHFILMLALQIFKVYLSNFRLIYQSHNLIYKVSIQLDQLTINTHHRYYSITLS